MSDRWNEWARAQGDKEIGYMLVEFGIVALFGEDLGGPLPPAIRRVHADQQRALRREWKRRGLHKAEGA